MVGNSSENGVSLRSIQHGDNFDFIFVFSEDDPNNKEWKLFVDLVKRNLDIANKLENMLYKKDKDKYICIEKDMKFYN